MASLFSFILAHQGDAADPVLLHWIKERLDQVFSSGPWAVVDLMGFVIFSIPVAIAVFYVLQSKRRSAETAMRNQDGAKEEKVH